MLVQCKIQEATQTLNKGIVEYISIKTDKEIKSVKTRYLKRGFY